MDDLIKREKRRLRKTLRALTDALPQTYIASSDDRVQNKLLALDAWKQAKSVFIYVSTGREPGTRGIVQVALDAGKIVAVPRSLTGGQMEACIITSLDDLRPGRFGIPEPKSDSRVLSSSHIELAVVPCIAADRQGYRLGHGGGYYDRYLARIQCTAVCLCRERLIQEELPRDAFDIPVDIVVTEQRCIDRNE